MKGLLALAGLPVALVAGLLADAAGEAAGRLAGAGPSGARPADLVRAWRRSAPRQPVTVIEAAGALLALAGGGLAAAAALGAVPGSAALLIPALVAAAAGARLGTSDPATRARAARTAADQLHLLAFEVAFVLALVAALARWRADGLEAVRGAQAVLGPGLTVGPAGKAAGLVLAALALAVAGGARVPRPETAAPGRGFRAEPALLSALGRWSSLGAGAIVVAALVAGPAVGDGGGWAAPARALPVWIAATIVASAGIGAACRGLGGRPGDLRVRAGILAAVAVAVGASLVLVAG